MSDSSARGRTRARPVWLALAPDPVLAFLHLPPSETNRATGVLVCPPFGWDEMCSYRGRRTWADALADAGYPAARIDLPGTGDSGGSATDPGRLAAWTAAVSGSAAWLRERTGCARIAAIGIGLGGMLAWRAIADGAAIDDLVLWGVADSGRRLLRELHAQHSMIAGRHPDDVRASPPLPDGAAEAAGYLLSAETARELGELQLTSLALPEADRRRVLLLRRGRLGVDKRLREHLEQAGSSVTVADGLGYDELMAPPQEATLPGPVVAETRSWLDEGQQRPAIPTGGTTVHELSGVERSSIELRCAGAGVRETPLRFEIGSGRLMGVLSEPTAEPAEGGLCAVLLNAGALRHIGPSRTWVEIARRWAARGVPTLRVDLEGIGEADGDERRYEDNAGLYAPEMLAQTLAVLDELEARGLSGRFVLVGLCSGANWALHAALARERVAAALMINLYPIFWNDTLVEEHETRRALASLRGPAWRRIARRDVSLPELRRAVHNIRPDRVFAGPRARSEFARAKDVDRVLDQLRDQGTQALLLLGREEPLYDQFVRQGQIDRLDRWPNLRLERLPSTDHSFRALWVQREVHAHLDAALDRALLAAAPALGNVRRQR